MKTVRYILRDKGQQIWTIAPDASVYEALQRMAEKEIGALVVMEAGQMAGIFTERDYARKVILRGKFSRDTPVREVMVQRVVYVSPDQTVGECMALMTDRRVRHLPVIQDGQLVGLISIGDLVKEIIADHEFMIGQLENYIMDRRA